MKQNKLKPVKLYEDYSYEKNTSVGNNREVLDYMVNYNGILFGENHNTAYTESFGKPTRKNFGGGYVKVWTVEHNNITYDIMYSSRGTSYEVRKDLEWVRSNSKEIISFLDMLADIIKPSTQS